MKDIKDMTINELKSLEESVGLKLVHYAACENRNGMERAGAQLDAVRHELYDVRGQFGYDNY